MPPLVRSFSNSSSRSAKGSKRRAVSFGPNEQHQIEEIDLEHHQDVYYSRKELFQQRQELMESVAVNTPPEKSKKKKTKKKSLSKRQKWQLQHIRAINERRACFRKWVYIRNRFYLAGAFGYGIYWVLLF